MAKNYPTEESVQILENLLADKSVSIHVLRRGLMAKASDGSWYNIQSNTDGELLVKSDPLQTYVDESVANTTYIGQSQPGTSEDDALWRIRRCTVADSITKIDFADGDDLFDNIWSDRAGLNYSTVVVVSGDNFTYQDDNNFVFQDGNNYIYQ